MLDSTASLVHAICLVLLSQIYLGNLIGMAGLDVKREKASAKKR